MFQQQNQAKPVFGGGSATSQGMFGQQSNTSQSTGLFGNSNTQSTGAFGAASSNNQAFLGSNNTSASSYGTSGSSQFGQNQPTQGGLFGQQPSTQGVFGQQQQQQGGGIFGNQNQGGFNQNTQGQSQGLFGGSNQTQQQGGLFGQPTQQNNAGNSQFPSFTKGVQAFSSQGASNPFGNTSSQGTGLFGGGTNQTVGNSQGGTGMFGTTNNNSSNPSGQGGQLFGTFASPTQNNQNTSIFGGGSTTPTNNTSTFGTTSIVIGGTNNAPNNKLGGASWGVPTNQPNTPAMQPTRSKNPKLDSKHLVKCIAAMEQFQGSCKEELRINFIQSGGQQPALNQQQAAGNAGFAKGPTNPLTTIPSFGGSTNLGGTQSAIGGTQSTLFGANKPATSSIFGTSTPTNTGSNLFPQTTTNPSAPGTLFGGQTQQNPYNSPQTTSLLGGQPQQSTLFGGQTTQPGSLFGNPTQTQSGPSLFGGAQTTQPSTLFGAAPLQPPPTLMTTPGVTNPNTSLFGPQPTPNPQLSPNPLNGQQGTFANLMAPFFQQNQQMDPSMQLLLPQLLLSSAMAQSMQNQGQNPSTPQAQGQSNPLEIISKLFAGMTQNKPDDKKNPEASANENVVLNPTPFDEFMK